jgi:hypothetical protein
MPLVRATHRGVGHFNNEPELRILRAPAGASGSYVIVQLLNDLSYLACDGRLIITPHDLVSDGASIPVAAQAIIGSPVSSENAYFGLTHDGLYRFGGIYVPNSQSAGFHIIPLRKEECDLYAEDMAICAGHSEETAHEIYLALLAGGAGAWNENAKKRAAFANDYQLSGAASIARLLAAA